MSLDQLSLSDLQVVLVGANHSGKTAVKNTLAKFLKITAYKSEESDVTGREVSFIDTPGWWRNNPLTETAEFIKQDLVLRVAKRLSGPHAFLLVIGSDTPFTERNRMSIEEHLQLFGEGIWKRTIVVLTGGEYLGKTVEQLIESEGKSLKWLVEKCGNRCHTSYINSFKSCDEVSKLVEQIDVVAKTRDSDFEFDEKKIKDLEEKRNTCKSRAIQRRQNVTEQRETLQNYGLVPSLPEVRVLLLGWLFSGKTTACKTILGLKDDAERIRTDQCERKSGEVAGRQVSVVDTPGWWKYFPAKYTPEWVKTELQRGMTLDSKAPHVILLAVPVDTAFVGEHKKVIEDNMRVFGDQVWRHTMLLFTCGDMLGDTSIEEHIECEGEYLAQLVEKCGNSYHVLSWNDKEDKVIELIKKLEKMVARNSLFHLNTTERQRNLSEDMSEELEEEKRKLFDFLDLEWQRMDKAVEKKIKKICSKTVLSLRRSKDALIDFRGSHSSSEKTSDSLPRQAISQLDPPEARPSIEESGHEDQQQTSGINADQLEHMREMLEKEWSRREIGITERFQRMLSVLSDTGGSSEADVHDLESSIRKVIRWFEGTSGHGSIMDDDIGENE